MTTDYNQLSDTYDQTKISPLRKYVDKFTLLKILGDVHGKSVLDLACGHGHYTRLVKQQGAARVVGVDVSQAMIAEARSQEEQAPLGIDYLQRDVTQLGQLGSFDITLAAYLFPYAATPQHLSDMCRSIYQNLKPGGRLVAATFNPAVTKAELPAYQPYGVNLTAPTGLQDGATLIAQLDLPAGSLELTAHYWSKAAYERALAAAHFQQITWHPMQVPAEALQLYGQAYWQTYQHKSLDVVLVGYRI